MTTELLNPYLVETGCRLNCNEFVNDFAGASNSGSATYVLMYRSSLPLCSYRLPPLHNGGVLEQTDKNFEEGEVQKISCPRWQAVHR